MHKAADRIRNVALVGHRGSGKTSLHEALLFQAGAVNRLGSVVDGTTVSDVGPRREGAPDVDLGGALLVRVAAAQGQPARHPRRLELRRRRARRPARVRVGGVRGQRGDGRRGAHHPPVAARRRARPRPAGVRQHARPRARRLLPHARVAQGRLRPARRRDRDPDRLRARGLRRDRPRRHEGLRVRRRPDRDNCREIPIPDELAGAGRGVPREADGRGLRDLRRADGALPRGRRDLPRGDRHGAQGGHQPRRPVPGHLRRRDPQPGHQPAARRDRRGPSVAGQARRPRGRRA